MPCESNATATAEQQCGVVPRHEVRSVDVFEGGTVRDRKIGIFFGVYDLVERRFVDDAGFSTLLTADNQCALRNSTCRADAGEAVGS